MSNNINGLTSTHSSTSRSRAQSSTHHSLTLLRGEPTGFALYGNKGTAKDPASLLTISKV